MRYIEKRTINNENPIPTTFTDWLIEEQTAISEKISDPNITGTTLWEFLNQTVKDALKKALLEDQGFICCYCGKRIENDLNTRIEHLKPKHKYKEHVFSYRNLLASCQGGTRNVIHIAKTGELLRSIADQYGVDVEHLEEVYFEVDELELFRQKYDIEHLQAGDRLVIFPLLYSEQQHCDNKKGNNEIVLTPLQEDCATHFDYDDKGKIIENDTNRRTIDTLGLNNNPHLNRLRVKTLTETSYLKRRLIADFGNSKTLFQQKRQELFEKLNSISPKQPKLRPFVFVTIWSLSK